MGSGQSQVSAAPELCSMSQHTPCRYTLQLVSCIGSVPKLQLVAPCQPPCFQLAWRPAGSQLRVASLAHCIQSALVLSLRWPCQQSDVWDRRRDVDLLHPLPLSLGAREQSTICRQSAALDIFAAAAPECQREDTPADREADRAVSWPEKRIRGGLRGAAEMAVLWHTMSLGASCRGLGKRRQQVLTLSGVG